VATLTLAGVFAQFKAAYQQTHRLSDDQHRAVHDILACRTDALGIQRRAHCGQCGFEAIRYCSCRNRHCPQCQGHAAQQWVERRCGDVLDVPYYHLVFTLPHELNSLARRHARLIHGRLFDAVWHTLGKLGEQRLGGQLGMTAVLHTWGQTLSHHVHLHCLVPAGAFAAQDGRWRRARSRYLFPVKVMQQMFRGRYVAELRRQRERTCLSSAQMTTLLEVLMAKPWNIHARPVLGHAHQVLDYLGRYTHRIALAESRLVGIRHDQVLFRYRDYRQNSQDRVMTLAGTEFMRRYLTHVLPRGFQRVRHYGFLANRLREDRIRRIQALLPVRHLQKKPVVVYAPCWTCPYCGAPITGASVMIREVPDTS